jgi:predicted HAD superfamily Cof-like phosphohydrolase
MSVKQILTWFQKAVPAPEKKNFNTQVGVHFEEVAEMMDSLAGADGASQVRLEQMRDMLSKFATEVKSGQVDLKIADPVEYLDALGDQIVTAVGSAHMGGVDILGGLAEIADSNDSKFDEDGMPIFNEDRKIMKGPNYFKPDLQKFVSGARFLK